MKGVSDITEFLGLTNSGPAQTRRQKAKDLVQSEVPTADLERELVSLEEEMFQAAGRAAVRARRGASRRDQRDPPRA